MALFKSWFFPKRKEGCIVTKKFAKDITTMKAWNDDSVRNKPCRHPPLVAHRLKQLGNATIIFKHFQLVVRKEANKDGSCKASLTS